MRNLICILLFSTAVTCAAQTHTLQKIWETDTIVAIPESVLPDLRSNILYVSLIDGEGWKADGKGGVGKLGIDGKNYDSTWIKGLSAPKGMGIYGNRMYVADIADVVVIDIDQGRIEKKISVPAAEGLNDITITHDGIVYVSDSRKGKIWQIKNGIPSLYMDSVAGVNGVKAIGNDLYIGAGKDFIKATSDKTTSKIAEVSQSIDGIEPVGNGDFILTSWIGYIFYVTQEGKVETLLDSHDEKMNTADLGYDPGKRILYVPTFNAKKVVAYTLN